MRRTKKSRAAGKAARRNGAGADLVIVDEVPDMRQRILCAPDVFERVNKAVEDAGQAGVYLVQRSLFVQPGQVYLTGLPVPLPSSDEILRDTVTVEGDWIKLSKFVDPYYAAKSSALGMITQGLRP